MLGDDATAALYSFVIISFTCAMVSEKVTGFLEAVEDSLPGEFLLFFLWGGEVFISDLLDVAELEACIHLELISRFISFSSMEDFELLSLSSLLISSGGFGCVRIIGSVIKLSEVEESSDTESSSEYFDELSLSSSSSLFISSD